MQVNLSGSRANAVNTYVSNSHGAVQQFDLPQNVDRASISEAAQEAAAQPQDSITLSEYLDGLSQSEKAYFKAGILSKLSESPERNLAVAMDAAQETMQTAEKRGQQLDIDEVYLSIKQGFIPQNNTVDLMA